MAGARFAEIVVNTPVRASYRADEVTPLGPTFHYSIPPALQDRLQVGHLVRVPFRTREVHGLVVGLHDESPVDATRPILELVHPEPLLTPLQLRLSRWIANTYLTPWLYALKLFLPPRFMAKSEPMLALVPGVPLPPDLTPEQRLLVARLQAGPQPESALKVGGRNLARPRVVQPLLERGILRRYHGIAHTPPGPKQDRQVRLLADEETVMHVLPQLGRRSAEADVLTYLWSTPDPLPTVQTVMEATGCSPAVLKRLAAAGLVHLTPATTRVVAVGAPDDLRHHAAALASRAPAQAHLLRRLLEANLIATWEDLRAQGASRTALKALEQRGLVRVVREPATVHLAVDPEEAFDYILRRKGLDVHRRVVEALNEADGPVWIGWVYAETGANRKVLRDLEAAGLIAVEEVERWRDPLADKALPAHPESRPTLTPDQENAWQAIRRALDTATSEAPPVFLLHGVTGSGKTEIYLKAVEHVLAQGRRALYLVPEIALTPQTVRRVAARFPGRVALWHSDLSVGERFDTWRRVRNGDVDVVVGTRSALFLPLDRVGLIVVDEEHDESYKNQRLPYYHARDVALELARLTGSTVILGSATPDVGTYTRARAGQYHLLTLPQRILAYRRHLEHLTAVTPAPTSRSTPWQPVPGAPDVRAVALPPVRVVDMRLELKAGNRSIFSRALQEGIRHALAAGEQVILFMNRRGRATFVLCRDCGHVLRCERCDVPLTFHLSNGEDAAADGYLLCHHCNRRYPNPDRCPNCGSTRIRYFGGGTQRVEAEVKRLFPQARVLRWDRDVTLERGAHWRILEAFANHQADILIGTQMLAKGLDLPRVTLVGVVSADEGLFLPDFRAAERTFQVLTQVAGRAGRGLWGGRVIVQTYNPDHYAIRAAARHDYARFYRREMQFREQMHYPPVQRLVRLLYTHTQAHKARREAERLAADLRDHLLREGWDDVDVIGPAPCFYTRLRGQYRWHILLRGPDPITPLRGFPLPRGWRADVAPLNLL